MNSRVRSVRRFTLEHRSPIVPPFDASGPVVDWQSGIDRKEYLRLYIRVGELWNWYDRRLMPEQDLDRLLSAAERTVGILKNSSGAEVGFTELCQHSTRDVEIAYFGLFPECTGRGLGRDLLAQVLLSAWNVINGDGRVWLTTCEWDSPSALPFYQRMGFQIVGEDIKQQCVPD